MRVVTGSSLQQFFQQPGQVLLFVSGQAAGHCLQCGQPLAQYVLPSGLAGYCEIKRNAALVVLRRLSSDKAVLGQPVDQAHRARMGEIQKQAQCVIRQTWLVAERAKRRRPFSGAVELPRQNRLQLIVQAEHRRPQ